MSHGNLREVNTILHEAGWQLLPSNEKLLCEVMFDDHFTHKM